MRRLAQRVLCKSTEVHCSRGPETNDHSHPGPQAAARRRCGIFIPILRARLPNNALPYFLRFRDVASCAHIYQRVHLCMHPEVDLERFMPGARCNGTSSLPLFLVKTTRDNIIRVSINFGSAIRFDFILLNMYTEEIHQNCIHKIRC